jgi:hypothetical protein
VDKKRIIAFGSLPLCFLVLNMVTKVNKLFDKLPFRVKLSYSAVMANIIGLVGIGVSGVALLFAIIALAAEKWEIIEVTSTIDYEVGLWEICSKGSATETCVDIDDVSAGKTITLFFLSKRFFVFFYFSFAGISWNFFKLSMILELDKIITLCERKSGRTV